MKNFHAFIVEPKPGSEPPFEDIWVCERRTQMAAQIGAMAAFNDNGDAITSYLGDVDCNPGWHLPPTA